MQFYKKKINWPNYMITKLNPLSLKKSETSFSIEKLFSVCNYNQITKMFKKVSTFGICYS